MTPRVFQSVNVFVSQSDKHKNMIISAMKSSDVFMEEIFSVYKYPFFILRFYLPMILLMIPHIGLILGTFFW